MIEEGSYWFEMHDDEAVAKAIAALSRRDLDRIEMAAERWIQIFGLDGIGRDHDDLMSEAVARTLSGKRSWRREVDFVHHLDQTMRSIASSWRKSLARQAAAGGRQVRSSDLAPADDGEESPDPIEEMASREAGVEARLIGAQRVEAFESRFAGDLAASAVIAGWAKNLKGPEIQQRAGITKKQFEAAVLRIRRSAQRGGESVH